MKYELPRVAKIEKGEFTATVAGSEEYTVFMKLDEQRNVVSHSCDCPYDWAIFVNMK